VSESIALEGEIVIDTVSNVFLQQGLLQRVFSPARPGYRGCHTSGVVLRFDGWMNLWLAIKELVLMGGMELIASTLADSGLNSNLKGNRRRVCNVVYRC
jgi:hypothetical protein